MRSGVASVLFVSLVLPASPGALALASDPGTREVAADRLTDAAPQRQGIPAEIEGRLVPENVEFVAAHEAAIARLMAEVRSAAREE